MEDYTHHKGFEIKTKRTTNEIMFGLFYLVILSKDLGYLRFLMDPHGKFFHGLDREEALDFFEEQFKFMGEIDDDGMTGIMCCLDVYPGNLGIEIMMGLWPFINSFDEPRKIIVPVFDKGLIVGMHFGYRYLSQREAKNGMRWN